MFFRQAAATTAGIAPPAQPGIDLSKTIINKCILDVSHSLNVILYK